MIRGPRKRITKQRLIILEALLNKKIHPTADELYAAVRQRLPKISLGTVYRNLQTLAADGEIRILKDSGRMRFDSSLHDHYHVRCLSCGLVDDVPESAVKGLSENMREKTDYRIVGFKVEFVGICPECDNLGKEVTIEEETLNDFKLLEDDTA